MLPSQETSLVENVRSCCSVCGDVMGLGLDDVSEL